MVDKAKVIESIKTLLFSQETKEFMEIKVGDLTLQVDTFEVGAQVMVDGKPAIELAGEHILETGETIVIDDEGKLASITSKVDTTLEDAINAVDAKIAEIEATLAMVKERIDALEAMDFKYAKEMNEKIEKFFADAPADVKANNPKTKSALEQLRELRTKH